MRVHILSLLLTIFCLENLDGEGPSAPRKCCENLEVQGPSAPRKFCESLAGQGPRVPHKCHDPLSKITIKSRMALFKKDQKKSSIIHLRYSKDVHVAFDDGSKIETDNLDAFVNIKTNEIEKIIFSGNVFVERENKKLWADRAELIVAKKICKLDGHVKVEQLKNGKNDIPMTTECGCAKISWEGDEVELLGSAREPVSTTIKLDGKLRSLSKKSQEKKAKKL